ncbi:MAG: hypothetical protein JNL38_11790 [Myxococcales bacterium]|nr:hypothetical protein [Myxococcales bacterium]
MSRIGLAGALLAAGVAVAGCRSQGRSNGPAPEASLAASCDDLTAPPPGAVRLCGQHVTGAPGQPHIEWSLWATRERRADVEGRYRKLAATCRVEVTGEPALSIARGDRRLSAHDASRSDYPTCGVAPSPEHATVVVASTLVH